LSAIAFTGADTGYLVGGCGTILKTYNGGGYPMGVPDIITNQSPINLYPNPASTEITVEIPDSSAPGSLIIYNLQGQELLSFRISGTITKVDISKLPSGVYFARLTGEKTVEVRKIIKE
jgi:hypothetical protein